MKSPQLLLPNTQIYPSKLQDNEIPSEDGLMVSEEVYWEKYYEYCGKSDFTYEWKNGRLEEKPVSDYLNDLMIQWCIQLLQQFLAVHPIGKLITIEMGFRFVLPGETVIRRPDFSVVLSTNPVILQLDDRSYSGIFDLCIELISDATEKDIRRDTVEKKREYAIAGVKEYYILDARGKETAFYRRNPFGAYDPIPPQGEDIIKSEVLPGFQFRISDLYLQPSFDNMAEDPVYREFVYLSYQAEKQRAEQEKQRAEREQQRAERLAAKLRSLGISAE